MVRLSCIRAEGGELLGYFFCGKEEGELFIWEGLFFPHPLGISNSVAHNNSVTKEEKKNRRMTEYRCTWKDLTPTMAIVR